MEADKVLDCRGLHCPVPVVKTKKMMDSMSPGEILKVECTDKGSKADMPAFARRTGNELLESSEDNGVFIFFLKKK